MTTSPASLEISRSLSVTELKSSIAWRRMKAPRISATDADWDSGGNDRDRLLDSEILDDRRRHLETEQQGEGRQNGNEQEPQKLRPR